MDKVCIIVPHGDDEATGFAGAIQKHVAKKDHVSVVFVRGANSNDNRSEVQIQHTQVAKKILGYSNIRHLHIPKSTIPDNPSIVYYALETVLLELQPSIVYTTFWGDNHQDHQITYDCVSRLVRVWGGLKVKQFYVGEIASSTDQSIKLPHTMFVPNYYVKMTRAEFQKKVDSLLCYSSEIMTPPHPRSAQGLETLARFRGMECDSDFAEAFMSLRTIV